MTGEESGRVIIGKGREGKIRITPSDGKPTITLRVDDYDKSKGLAYFTINGREKITLKLAEDPVTLDDEGRIGAGSISLYLSGWGNGRKQAVRVGLYAPRSYKINRMDAIDDIPGMVQAQ